MSVCVSLLCDLSRGLLPTLLPRLDTNNGALLRFKNNCESSTLAGARRYNSGVTKPGQRSAGCNFGQTAGPSLIKFGTREGGREGGRGGRGGEGRGGEGRGGEGRGGEGRGGEGQGRAGQGRGGRGGEGRGREGKGGEGRGGEGRGGEGRGVDCPHFPQTRTFVTAEPSRTPPSRVTG